MIARMRLSDAIILAEHRLMQMQDMLENVGDVEVTFENDEKDESPVNGIVWGSNGKPDGLTHRGDRHHGRN